MVARLVWWRSWCGGEADVVARRRIFIFIVCNPKTTVFLSPKDPEDSDVKETQRISFVIDSKSCEL